MISKIKTLNILKNSQISIFIIIGVILVAAGIVYFIFSQTDLFQSPQARSQEQISEILTFCVGEELENSVRVLQFKGGRINADPLETQKRVDVFDFDIYSWSVIPTIEEMQTELEVEVEQKSIGCIISNLQDLTELYEITGFSQDLFNVEVLINPSRITAIIDMPLNVRMRGQDDSWEYSSLTIEIPSALHSNFELAKAIFQEHTQNNVFEQLVLEQISMAKDYSDPRASVPTQGIQFSCNTPIFRATEIQNTILALNDFNFNFLYFEGTSNIENRFLGYDESIREYYDNIYVKELNFMNPEVDISRKEVSVVVPRRFSFDGEAIYNLSTFRTFRVNGLEEEFIRPAQLNLGGSIPMPCISVFSKVYDLDYDILVEIESFESGEFEVFRVPIRIQIESSEPSKSFDSSRSLIDSRHFTLNSQNYCNPLPSEEAYLVDIMLFEATSVGTTPLFNVDVGFSCVGITCSEIGTQTNQLTSSEESRVRARLPFCSNGRIIAQREGFLQVSTLSQAEELNIDSMCSQDSILPMNEMIERGDFNGRIPFLDVCMVRLKEIELDITSTGFFNIERAQTVPGSNLRGELVIVAENSNLGYSTTGYFDFQDPDSIEHLKLPNVDLLNLNISIMYYENNELLSYYQFENREVELTFASSFFGTIPLMSSQIDTTEAFDLIEDAYENGFLDVNFGFVIN